MLSIGARIISGLQERLPYDRKVKIKMSISLAPELGEAVREAAAEAGMTLSEGLAEAAESKLRAEADDAREVKRRIRPIHPNDGRKPGELLATAGMTDAIDATVALLTRPGDQLYASDADDLRRLCEAAGNKASVIRC